MLTFEFNRRRLQNVYEISIEGTMIIPYFLRSETSRLTLFKCKIIISVSVVLRTVENNAWNVKQINPTKTKRLMCESKTKNPNKYVYLSQAGHSCY